MMWNGSMRVFWMSSAAGLLCMVASSVAQELSLYHGDPIPARIEVMYVRGMNYLAATQNEAGFWPGTHGNEPGVVGLAVLSLLAHGDDPNYGPYAPVVKRAINFILASTKETGYIGTTMYNHGFATLCLAEAYGTVNDERIGPALEKAVGLILTSQANNPMGAWRYSPESRDADTTVSGAQLVALLAARNAGIGVPDAAIDKALEFYARCQSGDGSFGYTSAGGASPPRAAIGTLAFALAKRKDSKAFRAGFRYLSQLQQESALNYFYYYIYYAAQAYYHGDMIAWQEWNRSTEKVLTDRQTPEGGWSGGQGPTFSTACSLLALAVNYRLLPIYER